MKYICVIVFINLAYVSGKRLSETCTHENQIVLCHCINNEEFHLPINYNYVETTSLIIESCKKASIEFADLPNSKSIHDIQIQNISGKLVFEPDLMMKDFGKIALRNIGIIPTIDHKTFLHIDKIDSFTIENTKINYLNEQFTDIDIDTFVFNNVTIESMVGINWSGQTLKIMNTIMRNVNGEINLESIDKIEIINSTIEFHKSGQMSMYGGNVHVLNCVFSNISINVIAGNVVIENNCGDGMSSLRLSSDWVKSVNNSMPTEIIYTNDGNDSSVYTNINNIVCKAGDCKCRKKFGHNSNSQIHVNIYLAIILPILSHIVPHFFKL